MIFHPLKPGQSLEGREIALHSNQEQAKKYVYLIAGVHGDEVEGIYVLEQLFTWLKTQKNLPKVPLMLIPIANPDGYHHHMRLNANGVDLNRNLPTQDWTAEVAKPKYNPGPKALSEKENQFLVQTFKKHPPSLILSFHSWKPILNVNGEGAVQKVAELLHQHNDYPVKSDIGYPTPGSLGTFGPEKYQAGVLTFECPRLDCGKSLQEIWQENEPGLKELLSSDLLCL